TGGAPLPRARPPGHGRARPLLYRPVPASAERRRATARRHRPRHRHRPRPRRAGRADLGPRRLRARRDPRSPRRPAGAARVRLPLHLPRPHGGAARVPASGRHVPRPHCGDCADERHLRAAAPPVQPGAPVLGAVPGSGEGAGALPADGRDPEPDRPAAGLPVVRPVPLGPPRVRPERASARGAPARSPRRVLPRAGGERNWRVLSALTAGPRLYAIDVETVEFDLCEALTRLLSTVVELVRIAEGLSLLPPWN